MIKLAYNKIIRKSVKFYELDHIYKLYNGETGKYEKDLVSCSLLISKFFPAFERDLIASRVAKRDRKTTQQVIDEWSVIAKTATDFGTKVHLFAENFAYEKRVYPIPETEKEENYFYAVIKYLEFMLNSGWEVLSVEKIMFNNNISGTVDLIMINHILKQIIIGDWKTNKKIDQVSFSGNEYGFEPIEALQNCNYSKYCLQLGLYTRLLEAGEFYDYPEYTVINKILHITEKEVVEYVPTLDYKHYTKVMEQKYFNMRVR